jgi:hypothetical protein
MTCITSLFAAIISVACLKYSMRQKSVTTQLLVPLHIFLTIFQNEIRWYSTCLAQTCLCIRCVTVKSQMDKKLAGPNVCRPELHTAVRSTCIVYVAHVSSMDRAVHSRPFWDKELLQGMNGYQLDANSKTFSMNYINTKYNITNIFLDVRLTCFLEYRIALKSWDPVLLRKMGRFLDSPWFQRDCMTTWTRLVDSAWRSFIRCSRHFCCDSYLLLF